MNETTLRFYCLKKSNTEPFTQDFSTATASSTVHEEAKDLKEKTNSQG